MRRGFGLLLPAAALIIVAATAPVRAQDYPTRPVEIIVPFAAGGGSELLARLISNGLSKRLGQPFVVLNRPGANTNLGTLAAVRSKPDGYTLLIASIGLAANPTLYKKLAFEPQSDLEPITLIANSPTVLAVPPSLPVHSLAEFVAYVKARPGELNYASYGVGSGPHLATELFQDMTGVRMVHVPYGGGGPAALGAMTNQVQALFSSVLPVLGMLRGGTLKAIALASDHRSELLPDVPTFKESGARLPDRHLVRHARSRQDAARYHRQAPRHDGRRSPRPSRAREDHRAGRRGDRKLAGGIPRLHPRRDRPIGGCDTQFEYCPGLSPVERSKKARPAHI
jgi:tripartite-type tricarboxylate transporter receptor subunit TctC